MHMFVYGRGGQRLTLSVFLNNCPLGLLRWYLSGSQVCRFLLVWLGSRLGLHSAGTAGGLPYPPSFLWILGIQTPLFILAQQTLDPESPPQHGFLSNASRHPDSPAAVRVSVYGNYFLMGKLSLSQGTDWLSTPIASRGKAAWTSTLGSPIF